MSVFSVMYSDYSKLKRSDDMLWCLEQAGVKEWSGYTDALDIYDELKRERRAKYEERINDE